MKKGERKKQQKALQRRTETKLQRRAAQQQALVSTRYHILHAREYPIEGCWIRPDWKEFGLTAILIARRQPDGHFVFGSYIVDYYCLGVKDAFCGAGIGASEFRTWHLRKAFPDATPVMISPALAHEIIYGSLEFAARYGFKPHPDFEEAQHILDSPEQHPRSGTVEFGKEGKPYYIQGPHDNERAILDQLARTAGEGNYHFMVLTR